MFTTTSVPSCETLWKNAYIFITSAKQICTSLRHIVDPLRRQRIEGRVLTQTKEAARSGLRLTVAEGYVSQRSVSSNESGILLLNETVPVHEKLPHLIW